ncbi:prepilin peptidase CpaA [Tepidamorphus gemmatus]|uniref:Prepilin peptidase CpaA n=1 Tax=Tepidamorphus gemmatus TaxID=747076 RepID=A0A4V2UYF9_9HYPH|nr:prepilin peptidase [Tepidamorphus gemmatus]TCT07228.1 prepilin peptidase CpaA [Tepidamorphus gemmatus]
MLATILFLVFPAAMVLAACLDAFTMTIPNRLTIAFALLFAPAAAFAGLPLADIGLHLAAGAAMLAVAFGLFAMGWIGGGDAKFFAATALWLGWGGLLAYALYFSLIGGALTLAILAARAVPLPALLGRAQWLLRLHDARSGIPYGIALAVAGLIIYPATPWMQALVAG